MEALAIIGGVCILMLLLLCISTAMYSKLLKSCEVKEEGEDTFKYRHNKFYDTQKYIELRADFLEKTTELNLTLATKNRKKQLGTSKYPEYIQAELDAYALALSRK